MADFTQKQYLDFPGLKVYDGKIKELINAEVAARQEADNKHTADIGTNATNIQNLTKYVGTIPADATATDVIGYVQEKTSGIASDSTVSALAGRVEDLEENAVYKETGKGLSTNDYTTEEKNKLGGIATGAQVNVIEAVKVNGVALDITDKAVDVTVPTGALASKDKVAEDDLETTLATKLNGKADKTTTLAGYGITDAYTKTEADAKFADINIDTGVHSVTLETGEADKTVKLTVDGNPTEVEVKNIYSKTEADAAAKITLTTAGTATEGYLKTYVIAQNGTEIGKIDIPKELVVTSGQVVVNPTGQEEGKYIELTIANQDAPIYINVKDLVDVYTAPEYTDSDGSSVHVKISDDNVISAFVPEYGIREYNLASNAVTSAKIKDGAVTTTKIAQNVIVTNHIIDKNVTLAKLEENIQNKLNNSASISYVDTEVAKVYAAIASIPTTGENSIESLFA